MDTLRTRRQAALLVVAVALTAWPPQADTLLHARVAYDSGGGLVKGIEDAAWSHAPTNTLLLPGDILWVDEGGFFEIELAGGSFVRMADGTKAEILALAPETILQAWNGAFYIHRIPRSTGRFELRTPACTVDIEKDALVRIGVLENGATTVTVRWGRATVETDGYGRVVLRAKQRSYIDPGLLPSAPVTVEEYAKDAFDAWSLERAQRIMAVKEPPRVLYDTRPIGYVDLDLYGEWLYVDGDSYWRPTVVVDYVPYRRGHWSYVSDCGYVWVGGYPFSYVTCHYGRWVYKPHYGWLWTYRDAWAPAWVVSARCGPNFVWCPLDPWDRPATVTTSVSYSVGGLYFSLAAASYCYADDLLLGPCPVSACTRDVVTRIDTGDVYIWNIYAPSYQGRRTGHVGLPARARDYSPRRVIRGPDIIGPDKRHAAERIERLEAGRGRGQFKPENRKPLRLQTQRDEARRNARVRMVRVDEPPVTPPPERHGRRPEMFASRSSTEPRGRTVGEARTPVVHATRETSRVAPDSGNGSRIQRGGNRTETHVADAGFDTRSARTALRLEEPDFRTTTRAVPDRSRVPASPTRSTRIRTTAAPDRTLTPPTPRSPSTALAPPAARPTRERSPAPARGIDRPTATEPAPRRDVSIATQVRQRHELRGNQTISSRTPPTTDAPTVRDARAMRRGSGSSSSAGRSIRRR